MHNCVYLTVLISVIGIIEAATPIKNEKGSLDNLQQDVKILRARVKDLVSRLKEAERTKVILAERLRSAQKTVEQIRSGKNNKKALVARRAFTESQVAFYAALRHSVKSLAVHDPIIFDDVFTTTSPDVYNDANGMFTAPISGMYCFSWTNNVDATDYQSTELVLDGKPLAWAYADTKGDENEDDYGSSSQTVVLLVPKGGHVWVRAGAQGKGVLHGEDYSTFSGFLIFPTSTGSTITDEVTDILG